MSDPKDNLVSILVDGIEVKVPAGTNVVEAAEKAGREVPHYCYHSKLSVAGNCRMCMVETGLPMRDPATKELVKNEDGSPKIQWGPRPVIGCATTVAPGMQVKTDSAPVKAAREGVMEFLLINHPLDCPICDQAGECRLQEYATDYGRGYSRFIEQKNVKPKRTKIGPRVILDDERCILCSRCVRFTKEFAGDDCLGFVDRGSYSTLTIFPGKELAHNYSLNTVDICPVGALTSTDFRFKMRVWFLKETDSIDTESSVGCNTLVASREGVIHRITPRRNDEVNDTWMPDSGRVLYKQVDAEDRLVQPAVDGRPVSSEEAIAAAAKLLSEGPVAVVGSGRLSVEEQYLLRLIADKLGARARTWIVGRFGEGDGKLVSADRNPNVRGALLTGLIAETPKTELTELAAALKAGSVKSVLVVGEDLATAGIPVETLKATRMVFFGTHHCETSQHAHVELPLLTVFEKAGTFVNQQFRLQKFHQAIPGPKNAPYGLSGFTRLYNAIVGEKLLAPGLPEVWERLAQDVPELQGLDHASLPATGKLLAAERFAGLRFVEGPSLHFKPAAAATAQA